MSLIAKFKAAPQHLLVERKGSRGINGIGLAGAVVDKGERLGGSFLLGFLKAKYRERFAYRGVGGETLAGAAGYIVAGLANVLTRGNAPWAAHFERLGDVGLGAHMLAWGAEVGAAHAGIAPKVVSQAAAGTKRINGQQVVGAIPAAKSGTVFLTDQDIAQALLARK